MVIGICCLETIDKSVRSQQLDNGFQALKLLKCLTLGIIKNHFPQMKNVGLPFCGINTVSVPEAQEPWQVSSQNL